MSAILNKSARVLKQAQNNPDYIIKCMFSCKTAYDLAPFIIAYQHVTGVVPHNPAKLWQDGLRVAAEAILAPVDAAIHGKTADGLVTKYHEFIPMADWARSELAAIRREQGLEYRGPRMVRPRRNYGNVLPEHALVLAIQP